MRFQKLFGAINPAVPELDNIATAVSYCIVFTVKGQQDSYSFFIGGLLEREQIGLCLSCGCLLLGGLIIILPGVTTLVVTIRYSVHSWLEGILSYKIRNVFSLCLGHRARTWDLNLAN